VAKFDVLAGAGRIEVCLMPTIASTAFGPRVVALDCISQPVK
jgi:hypothetical protein